MRSERDHARNGSSPRAARALGLVTATAVLALGAGGCCDSHESARCGGVRASEPISGFTVVTTTGSDGSDGSMFFCIEHASTIVPDCQELDTPADDFERGQTDVFTIAYGPPIAVGDMRTFYIDNRGGGLFGQDWDMVALRVEAVGATTGARWEVYSEPSITCGDEQVDEHTRWYPAPCSY